MTSNNNDKLNDYLNSFDIRVNVANTMKNFKSSLFVARCQEEGCSYSTNLRKHLREHLVNIHHFDMPQEEKIFPCLEEFLQWKAQYEIANNCAFVKRTGKSKICGDYLYCKRSGTCVTKPKGNLGHTRARASMKLGYVCTAGLNYKEMPGGIISVTFFPTHYKCKEVPHKDPQPIKLEPVNSVGEGKGPLENGSQANQKLIASGTSIKNEHVGSSKLIRDTLLQSIPPKEEMIYEGDYNTLDQWYFQATNLQHDIHLLYYKPRGFKSDILPSFDFCLQLMTEAMRNMLIKFGQKFVYVTTLPIPKLNHHVIFLFVLDEFNMLFPACVMISSKVSEAVYTVFFKVLKEFLEKNKLKLNTKVFMTDRSQGLFKLWNSILGVSSIHKFCPHHVDADWRRYLVTIKNEELQCEVYDLLCELLEARGNVVKKSFEQVLQYLEEQHMCEKFLFYLRKEYVPFQMEWDGRDLLQTLGINKRINFEKTLGELKEMLEGKYKKYAKNSVKLLQHLLKKISLYSINRNSKISSIQDATEDCHRKCLDLDLHKIYPTESPNVLRVLLDKEEFVTKTNLPCDSLNEDEVCNTSCFLCCVCAHKYKCTCDAYQAQRFLCVHIHLVLRQLQQTLLRDVLPVNSSESKVETQPPPQHLMENTLSIDETSMLRKQIVESLTQTQDQLYLIEDPIKMRTLLKIITEVHALSTQMASNNPEKKNNAINKSQSQSSMSNIPLEINREENVQHPCANFTPTSGRIENISVPVKLEDLNQLNVFQVNSNNEHKNPVTMNTKIFVLRDHQAKVKANDTVFFRPYVAKETNSISYVVSVNNYYSKSSEDTNFEVAVELKWKVRKIPFMRIYILDRRTCAAELIGIIERFQADAFDMTFVFNSTMENGELVNFNKIEIINQLTYIIQHLEIDKKNVLKPPYMKDITVMLKYLRSNPLPSLKRTNEETNVQETHTPDDSTPARKVIKPNTEIPHTGDFSCEDASSGNTFTDPGGTRFSCSDSRTNVIMPEEDWEEQEEVASEYNSNEQTSISVDELDHEESHLTEMIETHPTSEEPSCLLFSDDVDDLVCDSPDETSSCSDFDDPSPVEDWLNEVPEVKVVPKRVVRTLRPQMHKLSPEESSKRSLKVLKPCVR